MVQLTLNTEEAAKPVKVPIFIFSDKAEATELAELIVNVKPTYLLNLSNSIESLKNHVKRNVTNNICYIIHSIIHYFRKWRKRKVNRNDGIVLVESFLNQEWG